VPDELEVVAHTNFPARETLALPFVRLGCDTAGLLRACVAWLRKARLGRPPRGVVLLKPRFEGSAPPARARSSRG
jgi:hypothetical protein